MILKDFIKKITSVEKKINLSELHIEGYNPWPYIRLCIWYKYEENTSLQSDHTINKNSKIKKIISLISSCFLYYLNPVKKQEVDILYFTRQSENQKVGTDEYFNRYADSFKFFFLNDYIVKEIEVNDQERSRCNKKEITKIDFLIKKARIKCKILKKTRQPKQKLSNDVNKIIRNEFGFSIDVDSELTFINCLADEFIKMLKKYMPKLVFLIVFYRVEAMAMSLACHRLGIRVVEYQHGAQNDYHSMYTNWNNIPEKGYELIPDVFWMWGTAPKLRIQNWASKTNKHKGIVGGNLWMSYARDNMSSSTGIESFYGKNKVNILVSLQGDLYFPEFLSKIMHFQSNNISWHFRDHPRLPISKELRRKIESDSNAEIEFSTKESLYSLLIHSDIHVTGYSTVAFEAQSFEVPTIFTHINAFNGYEKEIGSNGLYYADNEAYFNVLLNKLITSQPKIYSNYIVSDVNVHHRTLSLLME